MPEQAFPSWGSAQIGAFWQNSDLILSSWWAVSVLVSCHGSFIKIIFQGKHQLEPRTKESSGPPTGREVHFLRFEFKKKKLTERRPDLGGLGLSPTFSAKTAWSWPRFRGAAELLERRSNISRPTGFRIVPQEVFTARVWSRCDISLKPDGLSLMLEAKCRQIGIRFRWSKSDQISATCVQKWTLGLCCNKHKIV